MRNRLIGLLLASVAVLHAGSSIVMASGSPSSTGFTDPSLASTQDWTVEFEIHGVSGSASNVAFITLNGVGMEVEAAGNGQIWIVQKRDPIAGGAVCILSAGTSSPTLIRIRRDHIGLVTTCEQWNYDGSGYAIQTLTMTSLGSWSFTDGALTAPTGFNYRLGFLRVNLSLPALGSKPPTTAAHSTYSEWKFDGDTLDSSGNAHNITFASTPTFATTPNQVASAIIRTVGTAVWSPWLPLAAGKATSQLDGTSSFSLADSSSTVTCFWNSQAGPSIPNFSSHTSCTPTVSNLVFGSYTFALLVTDGAGNTASTTLDVGAVATDSNGVVVYFDDRLYTVLGPLIAWGKNPWEYVDKQAYLNSHYWGDQFQVAGKGGTWRAEWDDPRPGTAYATTGSTTVNGIGTNFADVYCGGVTAPNTPSLAANYAIVLKYAQAGGTPQMPPSSRYWQVTSCSGQTSITLDIAYDGPTLTSGQAVPWGTYKVEGDVGDWTSVQNSNSNINYYDSNGLGQLIHCLRSGDKEACAVGQFMGDQYIRMPILWRQFVPRGMYAGSAMLRALMSGKNIGQYPASQYDMWPNASSIAQNSFGCPTNIQIGDAREQGSCLQYLAMDALLDPDATRKSNAQTALVSAYTNMWQPQQTAAGAYGVGNPYSVFQIWQVTPGSATVTLHSGSAPDANYCGEQNTVTVAGTLSIASDRITVTGSGGANFSNIVPGYVIHITGTSSGQPWSMDANVATVPNTTTLTLANPWRGDIPAGVTFYRVYNGSIGNSGYWSQGFEPVMADGSFPAPLVLDDVYYACSVSGSNLILDKPYAGSIAVTPYRALYTVDLVGPGVQPFMMGYPEWGADMARVALATANPTVSAGYQTILGNAVAWNQNVAYDSGRQGSWYGVDFANCKGLASAYFPAFACSGTSVQQARDYGTELIGGYGRQYSISGSGPLKTLVDTLYNAAYAAPGYAVPPGFSTDASFADILDCCDNFTRTKYFGQTFVVGEAAAWPARRIGGVQPAANRTVQVGFTLGAAHDVQVIVTAPSLATSTTTCTASPCAVTVDDRQGTHLYQLKYRDISGKQLALGDQVVLN